MENKDGSKRKIRLFLCLYNSRKDTAAISDMNPTVKNLNMDGPVTVTYTYPRILRKGPKQGAVYDPPSGTVFHIDKNTQKIVQTLGEHAKGIKNDNQSGCVC